MSKPDTLPIQVLSTGEVFQLKDVLYVIQHHPKEPPVEMTILLKDGTKLPCSPEEAGKVMVLLGWKKEETNVD